MRNQIESSFVAQQNVSFSEQSFRGTNGDYAGGSASWEPRDRQVSIAFSLRERRLWASIRALYARHRASLNREGIHGGIRKRF